jgi:3-isopropylmalate/(R)-2-methylmalate dehydratase small subunit
MPERFTRLQGVAAPYDPVNVDTDQILPARFLKYPRAGGYGGFLFHDLRMREDGSENPDFVLNREPYRRARIFVGNANFGCGSSREGAAYAFFDYGVRSVIAPSFSDIFFGNCLKNGIVPARLPDAACAQLRALLLAEPGTELTVDLEQERVVQPDGTAYAFSIDPFFREMLLEGVDELGVTLGLLTQIEAFERRYGEEMPWAVRNGT